MVCNEIQAQLNAMKYSVLILILLEYGLQRQNMGASPLRRVLILILLEYGLQHVLDEIRQALDTS